jgi:sensor histidine kinase regulating citrate/malate metabolism
MRGAGATLVLTVEDDGQGIAATRAAGDGQHGTDLGGTGLGQRIIAMLAHKLRAEVEHDLGHRGTRVFVRIPDHGYRVAPAA